MSPQAARDSEAIFNRKGAQRQNNRTLAEVSFKEIRVNRLCIDKARVPKLHLTL